jgi:hypothetical protein
MANLVSDHRPGNYSRKAGFRPMRRCIAEFAAKAAPGSSSIEALGWAGRQGSVGLGSFRAWQLDFDIP